MEIPIIIIKANSPLNWSVELQKRKLVKMREIVKKKVAKRSNSSS